MHYPWDLVLALDEKRKSKKLAAFLVLIPSVLFLIQEVIH